MPFRGLQTSYHPVQTTLPLLLRTDRNASAQKQSVSVYLTGGPDASIFNRNLMLEPSLGDQQGSHCTHGAKTLTVALSLGVILVVFHTTDNARLVTVALSQSLPKVLPLR